MTVCERMLYTWCYVTIYAKAFYHVKPNILMIKLENLDIPNPLLHWVENFLIGKHQHVKIGQTYPDYMGNSAPWHTCGGAVLFMYDI